GRWGSTAGSAGGPARWPGWGGSSAMRWGTRTSGSAAVSKSPATGASGIPMRPSALSKADFLARFGGVYEASPWVAEAVWPQVRAGALDAPEAFTQAMRDTVDAASEARKLALIRGHPELASRARMAEASVREQSGAGLDQCSP